MATVVAELSVSLDGFIADPADGVEHLFEWCSSGPVVVPTHRFPFKVSEASAGHVREMMAEAGAVVSGRRLFDLTGGWNGRHPLEVPVVVLTHSVPDGWPREDAPFTFVTEGGIEEAVKQAKAIAGDKMVGLGGANVTQQAISAGLVDQIRFNLVPVILGKGIRYLENIEGAPLKLEGPRVIEGTGVTHLYYYRPTPA